LLFGCFSNNSHANWLNSDFRCGKPELETALP
jgi:hypothetical protein